MEYKGYIAMVEFDDSVGMLHGRVMNSGDYPIATFEATDVEGLRLEFRISVDEYFEACQEAGVEPQKPFSGKLDLRLGASLHQRVTEAATEDGISLNAWIKQVLEEKVSPQQKRAYNRTGI